MRALLLISLSLVAAAAHAQSSDVLARDDRFVLVENAPATALALAANDRPANLLSGAVTLTILTPPQHGTTGSQPTPGSINYTVAADYMGEDRFTYRICNAVAQCDDAAVVVKIQPHADLARGIDSTSGNFTLPMDDLRALPSARFLATPMVSPQTFELDPTVDTAPQSPWDGPAGVDWELVTLPARSDGRDVERHVFVPGGQLPAGQLLMLGFDDDGDGMPDAAEVRCSTSFASCEMVLTQRDDAPVSWWLLVHNVDSPAADATIRAYDVPWLPGDGSLVATGPGRLPRGRDFGLWLMWDDETQMSNARRGGFVRVGNESATLGWFPVELQQSAAAPSRQPLALHPGPRRTLAIAGSSVHRGLFVDVPDGATRLKISTFGNDDVDLALVRLPVQTDTTSNTVIPADPSWPVQAVDTGAGGNESVQISGLSLTGTRWYAVVTNNRTQPSEFQIQVEMDGQGPAIERGSYYNDLRSGAGIFLYPAASQLAGLWYTYVDGKPTWYYLQALQVQPNRRWTSRIYRSAWDGDSNSLTDIGEVTGSIDDTGELRLSYRLDGRTGSERMALFGSGCPVISGSEADVSSNWFDPAHAGTGYSVQMFPAYEYYAGYFYDDLGYARFVAAELDRNGGTQADLVLQQLLGACPTCAYTTPVRTNIGTLARRFLLGNFDYIRVDFDFANPLAGSWTSTDHVDPLGGPGTTQGCD